MNLEKLIQKYNVPAPRYTSYPTVPFWDESGISHEDWMNSVLKIYDETNQSRGISLYIHLPYCESLCTYCACNTRITKNHQVEERYIQALLSEWKIYRDAFPEKPLIREVHLGGGTPTFFTPKNLKHLINGLLENCEVHEKSDFGFEGHPNNTTREHLQALYDVGFRRVSYGVQDLDEKVMKTINRVQPFENVKTATDVAREIGYQSVNFDLIYGLPYQTLNTIERTFEKVLSLRPQRIAFYSYAHVPWIKPGQRSYTSADLPDNEVKRALYERGKELLKFNGYYDVGMDHFALEEDPLYKAFLKGEMHRNFMGYTTSNTDLLLGLGVSSISDAYYGYAQNSKTVEEYISSVESKKLAVVKGHRMTEEDIMVKQNILSLTCRGKLEHLPLLKQGLSEKQREQLNTMEVEGLIKEEKEGLRITRLGMAFLRNICMVFDQKLQASQTPKGEVFSKSI